MGIASSRAAAAIRLSLGASTTEVDIRYAAKVLATAVDSQEG